VLGGVLAALTVLGSSRQGGLIMGGAGEASEVVAGRPNGKEGEG